jgi:hypothetical protein
MPSSVTCRGPAAPLRPRDFKRTPTVQWISTSGPLRQRARSRTGFPRALMENSKSSSAFTARRSRCSTRRGNCRTSRRFRILNLSEVTHPDNEENNYENTTVKMPNLLRHWGHGSGAAALALTFALLTVPNALAQQLPTTGTIDSRLGKLEIVNGFPPKRR